MAKSQRRRQNVSKSTSMRNTGEIVLSAIKKLMKNTGWTARTIVKFIKMEYTINDPNISRKVSRALKRGVRLGLLQIERGRYRLNNMASLAHPSEPKVLRLSEKPRRLRMERALRIRSRSDFNRKRK